MPTPTATHELVGSEIVAASSDAATPEFLTKQVI